MKKEKIISEKGFTLAELMVAIVILAIFISVISTIFVNIYLNGTASKRSSIATGYMTQIAEMVDKLYYQDVTEDRLYEEIDEMNILNGYDIEIEVISTKDEDPSKKDLVKTVNIEIIYLVGRNEKTVRAEKIKVKEVLVTPNKPKLSDGMVPVKYTITDEATNAGYWQITSEMDSLWYSYDNRKWANVMLMDGLIAEGNIAVTEANKNELVGKRVTSLGSMFVWIPRYGYKILSGEGTATAGEIDVVFLYNTTNNFVDSTGNMQPITEKAGYKTHPSFQDGSDNNFANGEWDKELTGYWVAKFEAGYAGGNNSVVAKQTGLTYTGTVSASNFYGTITSGTTKMNYPVFMPKTYSYNYINIGDCYNLSKALTSSGNPYKLSDKIDSHMVKNSEWGAVSYLAQSKYGTNGTKIYINNVNVNNTTLKVNNVTGYAAETVSAVEKQITSTQLEAGENDQYAWNTTNGVKASTTGNIYGVYDMNGGALERTPGYIAVNSNSNINNYGGTFAKTATNTANTISTKYANVYAHNSTGSDRGNNYNRTPNPNRIGEAIWETSASGNGTTSWNNEYSTFASSTYPFTARGGRWTTQTDIPGIFAFLETGGEGGALFSFRVVLTP